MNEIMLQAELAQARKAAMAANAGKEMFVRICCVLTNHLLMGTTPPLVDGSIGIKKEQYDAVPKLYRIDLASGKVKPVDGDPNAAEEDMIVIRLSKAPEKSILQVVGGA